MTIQAPEFPIVYVRGYAALMSEIEDTVATPYMGFNLGSTKIRQKHDAAIVPFVFESPLIRLMKDHGYEDTYHEGHLLDDSFGGGSRTVGPKSVWIFRYYDDASESLGAGKRKTIPEIAEDLREYVLRIRNRICGNDADARSKFRVYLVAHSMGGLICRCYLQNICVRGIRKGNGHPHKTRNKELELHDLVARRQADADAVHLVDKVFTYGTPHNGIDIRGVNVPDVESLDGIHVRNFNRGVMADYLNLKPKNPDRVMSLNGAFPSDRFFCFVGSNYQDYSAFFSLAKKGTGPMSDGLVMMRNATVDGSPRAVAYRSHSGHYGIVNSEEGYQNLRRFLFGDVRIHALLNCKEITLPAEVQKLKDENKKIRASYHIETQAGVRGALYKLHERRVDHSSAILRDYDRLVKKNKSEYLFSGYLSRTAAFSTQNAIAETAKGDDQQEKPATLAFYIRVSIGVPLFEVDNSFWFDDHIDGVNFLDATVAFRLELGADGIQVRYDVLQQGRDDRIDQQGDITKLKGGVSQIRIPLGFDESAAPKPRPGFRGELIVNAKPWNNWH